MKWEKARKPLSNARKWVDFLPCYHITDLISEQVSDFRFGHLSVFSGVRKSSESNFFSLSNSLSYHKMIFWDENEIEYCDSHDSRQDRERENHFSWSSKKKSNWLSRGFPGLRILVELWVTSTSPLVVADKTCRKFLPNSSLPIYFKSLQQLPLSCKCSSKRSPHQ